MRTLNRAALTTLIVGLIVGYFAGTAVPAHAETCDRHVSGGSNLQAALNNAGRGATVCLSGTFHGSDIRPLAGQTVIGGTLTGSSGNGYNLKAGSVTLRNVEVAGYANHGVTCGPGSTIADSYIHDNDLNGIGCIANGGDWHIHIVGNRIIHNGSDRYEYIGASGIKILELSKPGHCLTCGALVEDNTVLNNDGNGIWFDRSSSGITVRGNTTSGNTHKGLRCEKCAGPVLWEHNVARYNKQENYSIRNSAVVTMHDNVASNGLGLNITYVRTVARKTYPDLTPVEDGYKAHHIEVHDTRLLGKVSGCGLSNVSCSR
jgi:parallel beta-helix repeat protein